MKTEVEEAFACINKEIKDLLDLSHLMMLQQIEESQKDDPDSSLSVIEDLLETKKELQQFSKLLNQIETRLDYLETEKLSVEEGAQASATTEGLRKIRVEVTQGMLNQKVLTLTVAKRRQLITKDEQFRIRMPDGQVIDTCLIQPGNRLQERGAIGRFYRENKVKEGDCVHLDEVRPGEWEITVVRQKLWLI